MAPISLKIPDFNWDYCYILNDGTVYKFFPDSSVKTFQNGEWIVLEDTRIDINTK